MYSFANWLVCVFTAATEIQTMTKYQKGKPVALCECFFLFNDRVDVNYFIHTAYNLQCTVHSSRTFFGGMSVCVYKAM